MKKFLITRPEHDDTTHYLSNWSKECISEAKKRDIQVFDLNRERATRKETESVLTKRKPQLVCLNGHGTFDKVGGHKDEVLIQAGENEDLLKNSIIYALSCQSGKTLGPSSIESGAKAYIGYKDDFIFAYNPKMMTKPTKDLTASLFLKPSNELINSLVKGKTVEEARKRSQQMSKKHLRKLMSSQSSEEDASLIRYIWWNMRNQVDHGDSKAKI
ncbi:MAG: hypothetical protein ACE5FT_04545 [Candidatus Nanoarchaeia archaeon]